MRNLGLPQRVVLVVALGLVCIAIDSYAHTRAGGWFAYTVGTQVYASNDNRLRQLVLRLVLVGLWTTGGVLLLRSPKR